MADGRLTLREFMKLSMEERIKRYDELSSRDQFGARMANFSVVHVLCNDCIHYRLFGKCDAFPDRIPSKHIDAVMADPEIPCGNNLSFKRKDME